MIEHGRREQVEVGVADLALDVGEEVGLADLRVVIDRVARVGDGRVQRRLADRVQPVVGDHVLGEARDRMGILGEDVYKRQAVENSLSTPLEFSTSLRALEYDSLSSLVEVVVWS